MAVLVEAISVVVRRDAIDRAFDGGWRAFVSRLPNATLCTDDQLARVGFMDPKAVENFVKGLEAAGLVFLRSGKCADIAAVDQQRGRTMPANGWNSRESRLATLGLRSLRAGYLRDRGWQRAFTFRERASIWLLRTAGRSRGRLASGSLSCRMRMSQRALNLSVPKADSLCSSTPRLARRSSSQVVNGIDMGRHRVCPRLNRPT